MTGLRIVKVSPVDLDDWARAADRCRWATFFHTPQWAALWAAFTEGTLVPSARRLVFSDGREAVFPMCSRTALKGLLGVYESSPAGTYGGCLSEEPLGVAYHQLIFDWAGHLNVSWRENPFEPIASEVALAWNRDDFTQVIDLSPGFAVVSEKWSKHHRRAIGIATRKGVEVFRAETLEHWRGYYLAYEDSLRRWGTSTRSAYPWRLFELLRQLPRDRATLWVASYRGVVIAGALCLQHNRHVAYWHGASSEEYHHLRPSHLLQGSIIKNYCGDDLDWYDLNPSSGLQGVIAFKRGFGAEQRATRIFVNRTAALRLYRAVRCLTNGETDEPQSVIRTGPTP